MARVIKQTETKPQKRNPSNGANTRNTNQQDIKFYYPEDIPIEKSLNNPVACANPSDFYYQSCNECHYELGCIYEQKYKYRKINM